MDKPTLQRSIGLEGNDTWWADLQELAIERGLKHYAHEQYPCFDKKLDADDQKVVATQIYPRLSSYIVDKGTAVVGVTFNDGFVFFRCWAEAVEDVTNALMWLQERHAPAEPPDEKIEVRYWCYGPNGPMSRQRQITANAWGEIEGNYTDDALERLKRMVTDFDPGVGGQLLLWTGPPGTGKTTALRAVAREWREWCRIDYIMDPEMFFGQHADYLNVVLLESGEQDTKESVDGEPRPQWRLLVLEDSGELLRKDAGEVTGKALGRLLNTVDGMIGQGLRIMVLVTTNEDIGQLHDAIARPGRCAVEIKFEDLDSVEADHWRLQHGLEETYAPGTLAELYAELNGFQGARQRQPAGFTT